MNDHEAQRIAAAANQLRPDWPTSSVLTLLRKNLMDRPRRDVAVALTWIACEPATSNPARVLESGPWWRAVAVEGTSPTTQGKRGPICVHCGHERPHCERRNSTDHAYEGPDDWMRRRPAPGEDDRKAKAREYARQAVGDTKAAKEPEPEKPAPTPNPNVARIRAAMTEESNA